MTMTERPLSTHELAAAQPALPAPMMTTSAVFVVAQSARSMGAGGVINEGFGFSYAGPAVFTPP